MRPLCLSLLLFVFLLGAYSTTAQNPYESLGVETKVLTLTEGKHPEFFPNKEFTAIGGVLLNTKTGEVVKFLEPETTRYSFDPTVSTRFLSVDPIAREFPELTPYQFASDSPIANIDLDGLERYWAADGSYLGKYGESTEMRIVTDASIVSDATNALADPSSVATDFFKEDLHNASVRAYEATEDNELRILRGWAKENRTRKREYAMSIFTKYIESDDGIGYFPAIVEGSRAKGPLYEIGKNAVVDPFQSTGPDGWQRSTTIHTHPHGDWNDFSNVDGGFMSGGGDVQWAIENQVKLYLVPPSGNTMGLFDPKLYTEYVLGEMAKDNETHLEELIKQYGGLYQLDHPSKEDYQKGDKGKEYWILPEIRPKLVQKVYKDKKIDPKL